MLATLEVGSKRFRDDFSGLILGDVQFGFAEPYEIALQKLYGVAYCLKVAASFIQFDTIDILVVLSEYFDWFIYLQIIAPRVVTFEICGGKTRFSSILLVVAISISVLIVEQHFILIDNTRWR